MDGNVGLLVHNIDPDVNSSTIEWIAMKFSTDIFSAWKMNPNNLRLLPR